MILEIIVKGNFTVCGIVMLNNDDLDCTFFFSEEWMPPNSRWERSRIKLMRQIDLAAKDPKLVTICCHSIAPEIWQFKSGPYRIPWFYDEGKLIICSHVFVKKQKKTPKAERDRAIKAREDYLKAKESGAIVFK